MTKFFLRGIQPSLQVAVAGFVGLVCLSLIGIDSWRTYSNRAEALQDAHKDAANIARSIAHDAEQTLDAADLILFGIVERLETGGAVPAQIARLHDYAVDLIGSQHRFRGIFIYDEAGDWLTTSLPATPANVNNADRDYFQFHKANSSRETHVGVPVKSRSGGQWILTLTRRFNHPDGSFAGVVLVSIDLDRLEKFYETFQIGQHGAILLARSDGTLLTRRPLVEANIGKNFHELSLFREFLPKAPVGDADIVSAIDGVERLMSYRRLESSPLVVSVALSQEEALVPWRRQARAHFAAACALAGVIGFLGFWLAKQIRRRQQAERLERAAAADYRLLADTSTDMIGRTDLNGVLFYVSPAISDLLGYAQDELRGLRPFDYVHPDDADELLEKLQGLRSGQRDRASHRYRLKHKMGTWVWMEVNFSLVRHPVTGKPVELISSARNITERVHAEEALQQSDALHRLLAANSSDMIVRINLAGIRLYVSPACRTLLGFEPEELVGKSPRDVLHPEDLARVEDHVRRLSRGAGDPICTYRIRRKAGDYVWVEAAYRFVLDPVTGEPVEFITSIRDISQRRAAEEAADRSARLARSALDQTSDYVIAVDAEWRITYLNTRLIEHLTQGRDCTGEILWEAFPSMSGSSFGDLYRQVMATREPADLEDFYRIRNLWYSANAYPNDAGIVVFFRDITDRKKADAVVRESQERLALVLEGAQLGTWRIDILKDEMEVNDQWLRIVGYDRSEISEAAGFWRQLTHPDDRSTVKAAMARHLASDREMLECEYRVRCKDGHVAWILTRGGVAERDGDGRPTILSGTNLDVTATRELREELERSNRDLTKSYERMERQAGELSALAEQLNQARHLAEAANRAKGDFLASMSHEIRTPLNGVLGFADQLLKTELSEVQGRYVRLQRDAGRSLLTVINDILDFSKLEAERLTIEVEDIDLPDLVDSTVGLFQDLAIRKGLTIAHAIDPTLPRWVRADGQRLRQVLSNLLGNAVKFTRDGSVSVVVRRADGEGAESMLFEVRDTGRGISVADQDKLFQRFSQIDGTISREFGGTGLGLAISRRLVELMHGEIGVDSVLGQGSTFWFRTLLVRGAEVRLSDSPGSSAPDRFRGMRVLVAEDNTINQILIETLLTDAGFEVFIVPDGAKALAAVMLEPYDLVLMDMQMPVMDGIRATQEIRRLPGPRADIPIVALSANVLAEEVQLCLDAGMQGHVGKPVELDALLSVIDRVVVQPVNEEPVAVFVPGLVRSAVCAASSGIDGERQMRTSDKNTLEPKI